MEHWPKHLAETGRIDAAQRNVLLAEAEAERLLQARPADPYIVAGSTGTNAATAKLMAAIAQLPNGAVVLPGLDHTLDDQSWSMVTGTTGQSQAVGHPQAALARLLSRLGVTRETVRPLTQVDELLAGRMEFLTRALLPPEATSQWETYRRNTSPGEITAALSGITCVDAENEHHEAQAIAVAMREVLEHSGRTAALITPDRNLARRVRSELLRWDLIVDDSGGETLRGQPAGILARLAIQLAQSIATDGRAAASPSRALADPVAVIALLNHGDVRLGYDATTFRRIREHVETGVLRGPVVDLRDSAAVIQIARSQAQDHYAHPSKKRIDDAGWADIAECIDRLKNALAPLASLTKEHDLRSWFAALGDSLFLLMQNPADDTVLQRADQEALADLISDFITTAETDLRLNPVEFAAFYDTASLESQVRGPQNAHPRLKILGLLEARLLSADVNILAGLDETIWPPAARADAFLNRPMREELGLSAPERRIGQTAHDFVEAMGASEVILTRSRKRDGAPAIPSRLIQRMAALAGEDAWNSCKARGERLSRLAGALDHAGPARPVRRPEPKPPVELRPTRLSVTQIETWRRDPYAIYARRILQVSAMDAPGLVKSPADIGNALHAAIDAYQSGVTDGESASRAHERMDCVALSVFAGLLEDINIKTFRWAKIRQALHDFTDWELKRRPGVAKVATEQAGALELTLADGSQFTLSARADRIERNLDGYITVVDYKSSRAPAQKVIAAGFAPQMTLEASIVEHGGFDGIPRGVTVSEGLYLTLLGSDGLKEMSIGTQRGAEKSFEVLKGEHLAGLITLATQFRAADAAYVPRPYPQYIDVFGEYDHLARVKEWSSGSEGGEA
ncbi:MAG: double-strand break repair protein AddB, partial [Beijerinckiaceae bacterium]|nr:double-strand break repair protein AddB [Beijerinckiaceae bacterium]